MAYTTYTTDAFVCGSRAYQSADRSFLLFTKKLGMVWATAKSVREERSRQRYGLQEFSLLRVSLVKGRGGWRIGSVLPYQNPFLRATNRKKRSQLLLLVNLLRRYVHGEGELSAVFADTLEVCDADPTDAAAVQTMHLVYSIRTLWRLGYVPDDVTVRPLLQADSIQEAVLTVDDTAAKHLQHLVEHAESISQL